MAKNETMICRNCGHVGVANTATPGSFILEVILWLCFLLPGILYSIWRVAKRHRACSACGSSELLPLNSPMGQKLQREMSAGQIAPEGTQQPRQ